MLSFSMMSNAENPYESIDTEPNAGIIGRKVIYYPQVTSTMDIARREARQGAPEGTVIIAGEQTGGRGRSNRLWWSPPGNIAVSVILYPDVSSLPYLVMVASLAVVHSVRSVTGLNADIKWPNDVLIGGKKVCGILIENEIRGDKTARAIIGIGINIELKQTEFENGSIQATSLCKETGKSVEKADIVKQILAKMEQLYSKLPDGGEIFAEWRKKLVTLGKRVVVMTGNEKLEGTAESVEESGALTLKLDDGSLTKVIAGDVTLREK